MYFDQNGNLLVSSPQNGGSSTDVTDRAGRIVGHVVVDSAGNVSVTSLPALPAGNNVIGHVIVDSGNIVVTSAIPTGFNLIGSVNIADSSNLNKAFVDTSGSLQTRLMIGSTPASAANPVPTVANAVGAVVLNQASAAQTASGTSADLYVGNVRELAVDINLSAVAGTTPQIVFSVQRKGADGIYYTLWTSAAQTAAGAISTSIGLGGPVNHSVGQNIRLVWTITGTTPSFTFSASITGK